MDTSTTGRRRSNRGRCSTGGAKARKLAACSDAVPSSGSGSSVEVASTLVPRSSVTTASAAAVPREEALVRLQEAADVLSKTPQGEGTPLIACVQAAAAPELVAHSDHGVRLWAAKCLAEGLRIFAPEPPLDRERLRATILLFLEQLGALAHPTGSTFVHAVGLLERLTEVRGFMLLFDCSNPEELLVVLVNTCLNAARASSEAAVLEGLLAQLLVGVLGEADKLPRPLLAALVEKLTPRYKGSYAVGLVRRVFEGLAHRSAVLDVNEFLNAAFNSSSSHDEGADTNDEEKLEEIEGLFSAVYELFTIEPALVARVIPNIHADLQHSDAGRRRSVTQLVGRLFVHTCESALPSSKQLLITTHPLLFDRFLERFDDADTQVRLAALDSAPDLLAAAAAAADGGSAGSGISPHRNPSAALANAAASVRQRLAERCLDPEDAVRLRVVSVAAEVAATSQAGLRLLTPILPEVFRRVLDKRPRIREVCAEEAARLYAKHALPAVMEGRYEDAECLAWAPHLLCEAYSVLAAGRLGHTSQLEEHIEQHLLGCGAGLQAPERARALLAFHSFASSQEGGARGLQQMLARKRDACNSLCQYLQHRVVKAAPVLQLASEIHGTLAPVAVEEIGPEQMTSMEATGAFDALVRLSPSMEDKAGRPESLMAHLRALDLVRDKTLWSTLERLTLTSTCSSEVAQCLSELDRLLRVHKLGEVVPVLRRALSSTWMLPEYVPPLLDAWEEGIRARRAGSSQGPPFWRAVRELLVDTGKYFPMALLPHVEAIGLHLSDTGSDDARTALRALSALGKRVVASSFAVGARAQNPVDWKRLVDALLQAVDTSATDIATRASACRKVVRALGVLGAEDHHGALREVEMRASELQALCDGASSATALHLAAALLEQSVSLPPSQQPDKEVWLEAASKVLDPVSQETLETCSAAAEVAAAAGDQDLLARLLKRHQDGSDGELQLRAAVATLRGLQHGGTSLTTKLLSLLADQALDALQPGISPAAADALLLSFQNLQKPATGNARLADRLRLCCTLPCVFALAPCKRHRDAVQRAVQASLMKAARQAVLRQEPLLDFAVACFLHFLSRLSIFLMEATAKASAFSESTKMSVFFMEALLRSDSSRSLELAGVALRVCDRVRYFVDRELPSSDSVHRAAYVLRYVIERRCPNVGKDQQLQGASRGSMPAELFAIRQDLGISRPDQGSIPVLTAAPPPQDIPLEGPPSTSPSGTAGAIEATLVPLRDSCPSAATNIPTHPSPLPGSVAPAQAVVTPASTELSQVSGGTGHHQCTASPATEIAVSARDLSSVARPMAPRTTGLGSGRYAAALGTLRKRSAAVGAPTTTPGTAKVA